MRLTLTAAALALTLTACAGGDEPSGDASTSTTPPGAQAATPTATKTPTPEVSTPAAPSQSAPAETLAPIPAAPQETEPVEASVGSPTSAAIGGPPAADGVPDDENGDWSDGWGDALDDLESETGEDLFSPEWTAWFGCRVQVQEDHMDTLPGQDATEAELDAFYAVDVAALELQACGPEPA